MKTKYLQPRRWLVVSLLSFLIDVSSTGFAATVTNTNDSGPGSLRDAIAATPAGGTVNFALSGCPCTIVLTTGDLAITKDLTVIGPGADQLTISGNNAWRPLRIGAPFNPPISPPLITVVVEGLKLTNGVAGPFPYSFCCFHVNGGGIISNKTNLTIRNSIISGNSAPGWGGGIWSSSSDTTIINSIISNNVARNGGGISHESLAGLSVIGTTVSDNRATEVFGGGIYSNFFTDVQIINSTIARNQAYYGSAAYIFQWSTVSIENSTLEGNTSGSGTLVIQITTTNISNSTISGNVASYGSAGIIHENFGFDRPDIDPIHSQMRIRNTTITNNRGTGEGGGVITYQEPGFPATTTLQNSIVARNGTSFISPPADVVSSFGGVFASAGYNLIGNAGAITSFSQVGDKAGTASAPIDPKLEELASNGGPTRTHALKFDSPALDSGFAFGSTTDQRGLSRPFDEPHIPNAPGSDGSDIGALEARQFISNPIDLPDFFVRQHYLDFLNREPDPPGNSGWQGILNNCPAGDTSCDRIHVSSAFFRSPEFQARGYFLYRFYPVAFGRKPDYNEFSPDLAKVSGFLTDAELETAKVAFITEFMSRPAFVTKFNGLDNTQYVDTLLSTSGVTHLSRDSWIAALTNGSRTRAQVLREIVESTEVYNKYYNQAFVVMQYFGYLRRQPDELYLTWIAHLDATGDYRSMIHGFMNSIEYRARFGSP